MCARQTYHIISVHRGTVLISASIPCSSMYHHGAHQRSCACAGCGSNAYVVCGLLVNDPVCVLRCGFGVASLFVLVGLGALTMYLGFALANFQFLFDKRLMKHPMFLKQQVCTVYGTAHASSLPCSNLVRPLLRTHAHTHTHCTDGCTV